METEVDAREVDQADSEDEELRSPYVEEDELDIGRWAHDAAVLALPTRVLCRPDCAGLCPVCGESLNDDRPRRDHDHWRRVTDPEAGHKLNERDCDWECLGLLVELGAPALRRARRAGRDRAARRRGTSAG